MDLLTSSQFGQAIGVGLNGVTIKKLVTGNQYDKTAGPKPLTARLEHLLNDFSLRTQLHHWFVSDLLPRNVFDIGLNGSPRVIWTTRYRCKPKTGDDDGVDPAMTTILTVIVWLRTKK